MKAVAAFLLVLGYLAVSHAWTCREAPLLYHARQIDAGQGKVVARDSSYNVYFLSGSSWYRLGTTRLKHVSVGPAGIWGVDTSNRVFKYIAGNFALISGGLKQVDAGGNDQVVGVNQNHHTYCLRSTFASAYKGVGSVSWTYMSRVMRYYSCGPLFGCWGVDTSNRVWVSQTIPTTCGSSGWQYVSGISARMIEVSTDGSVFVLTTGGQVYQRTGIYSSRRQGTGWTRIPMCLHVQHLSYDLGKLWIVSNGGIILQCTH